MSKKRRECAAAECARTRDKHSAVRKAVYCAIVCFALGAVIMALVVMHSFRTREMLEPEPPEIAQTTLEEPELIHAEPLAYVLEHPGETETTLANSSTSGICMAGFDGKGTDGRCEILDPEGARRNISPVSDAVHIIEDCDITYYCAERYPHICGNGDGLTATMETVTPGVTCAVDPSVIPLGSIVSVDYGDGVLHSYIAQDMGAWIDGQHIDICVDKHTEALELGRKSATVYWSGPEAGL